MMKRSFLIAAAVLAAACSEIPEKDLLKFPVKEVADLSQAVALSPEKVPLDLMTPYVFSINVFDGKLLTNADFLADHCVDVYDLNTGEELPGLCRTGRGPGEFTSLSPFFSVTDGSAIVYDTMTGIASEVSLDGEAYGSVTPRARLEEKKVGFPPILSSSYLVPGEGLLGYNTVQSDPEFLVIDTPYYALYDLNDGTEKRAFELFDPATLSNGQKQGMMTAFDLRDCMDDAGKTLCFGMGKMPVFAFLDIASGQARGFRLKGEPAFSANSQQQFFQAVCAQGKYIYALYGSDMKTARTKLYKLDWEGRLLNKNELDGIYTNCSASPDKLYLIGIDDLQQAVIYQLDLKAL